MRKLRTWQRITRVALLLGFIALLSGRAMAQEDLGPLMAEIEQARSSHQSEMAELAANRAQFEALLQRIDELKTDRAELGALFDDDDDLRVALRRAREVARQLQEQSEEIAVLSERIIEAEAEVVARIDARIAQVEQTLRQAETDSRGALIAELVELSQVRDNYLQSLPEVPPADLDQILIGLEEETSPEEILATVEELDDNERRLVSHLSEIEERLRALETQRDLRETTRGFQVESSLFEEGISSGRRVERSSSTTSGAESENTDGNGSQTPGNSGDSSSGSPNGAAEPTDGQTSGAGAIGEDEDPTTDGWPDEQSNAAPCVSNCEGAYAGGTDGDSDTSSLADDSNDRGAAPPAEDDVHFGDSDELTREENIPSSPSLVGVGAADRDPVLLWLQEVEIDGSTGVGLQGRIERLRRQRSTAEQTLDELRARRQELLERATALEQAEGLQ